MKNTKKTSNKLPVPGKVRKGVRFYCAAVLSVALVLVGAVKMADRVVREMMGL